MLKGPAKRDDWYNRTPRNKEKYRYVESYFYYSEGGGLLWEKQRFVLKPGKTLDDGERDKYFTQRRPDKDGIERGDPAWKDGWVYNLDGVEPVLYLLPQLVAGLQSQPEAPIFICKGEKDCHSLLRLNQAAVVTTSPSANFWAPEWNELFRDRHVVLVPDNDDVGKSYRDRICNELKPIARSVRVVELPGLGEGEDLTDWISNGGTSDQLTALVARAPGWQPFCRGDQILLCILARSRRRRRDAPRGRR